MAKFEFKEESLKLEIAGGTYYVTPTLEMLPKAGEFAKKAEKMHFQAEQGKVDTMAFIELCKNAIDTVLGGGTFDTIFTDRVITLKDCANLTAFIFSEISEYFKS